MATEDPNPLALELDLRPELEALSKILDGQIAALEVVRNALSDIQLGAHLMARTVRDGGKVVYAGAGSSALMAISDGLELSGTFGISPNTIRLCMAGGIPQDANMPGDTEDDVAEGQRIGSELGPSDLVIAVSASGRTPYSVALARAAREGGADVIAIANNVNAPLFDSANVSILLETPPEIIAGSTRLGAATAQKAALNLMSTLMGLRLGNVYDGMMVGVIADNDKLRKRAHKMVAAIAKVDAKAAAASLAKSKGAVKPAVLIALGASPVAAQDLLTEEKGLLRSAIERIQSVKRQR
ncbi:MAG: N-acetylmuramic acid 6-phosphate etherase [Paracoccaceae bacterium]